MAIHSSFMVVYLNWVWVRNAELHWMRDPLLSGSGWSIAKPMPKSLEVSVMRIVSGLVLKGCTLVVKSSLICLNFCSTLLVHTHSVPFLSRGPRKATKSVEKAVSWFASPRNSVMALYLLLSGRMLDWLTTCPTNEISFPSSSFFWQT